MPWTSASNSTPRTAPHELRKFSHSPLQSAPGQSVSGASIFSTPKPVANESPITSIFRFCRSGEGSDWPPWKSKPRNCVTRDHPQRGPRPVIERHLPVARRVVHPRLGELAELHRDRRALEAREHACARPRCLRARRVARCRTARRGGGGGGPAPVHARPALPPRRDRVRRPSSSTTERGDEEDGACEGADRGAHGRAGTQLGGHARGAMWRRRATRATAHARTQTTRRLMIVNVARSPTEKAALRSPRTPAM